MFRRWWGNLESDAMPDCYEKQKRERRAADAARERRAQRIIEEKRRRRAVEEEQERRYYEDYLNGRHTHRTG